MGNLTLNTANGAINLVPTDGSGTQTLNIGRQPNLGKVLQKYLWKLPTGQISPNVNQYTTAPTSSNTTEYTTHTVTPIGTNSTFIFEFSAPIDSNNASGQGEYVCLFYGSTLLATSYWYRRVAGSEPQMHSFRGTYTNTGNDQFTVSIRMKSSLSEVLSINRANGDYSLDNSAFLAVTEVAN